MNAYELMNNKDMARKMHLKDIYRPLSYWQQPYNVPLNYIEDTLSHRPERFDLTPEFQRGHVWTISQQEAFMGHLLTGGHVAPILWSIIGDPDTGTQVLLDGLQRLTAIRLWLAGHVDAVLFDGTRVNVSQITGGLGRVSVLFASVRLANDDRTCWRETMRLYVRLNSGGTVHSEEEMQRVKALIEEGGDDGRA